MIRASGRKPVLLALLVGVLSPHPVASSTSPRNDFSINVSINLGLSAHSRFVPARRAIQSNATCLPQFDWMDNSLRQSPCLASAYLLSACGDGSTWDTYSLNTSSEHYTSPTSENANGCRCSWAVYNTLQACAFCQGENYQSAMLTWSGYNTNCTGHLLSETTFYPADTPIPRGTAIPFWATIDPSTWHDGVFDPSAAQSLANQGLQDITEANRTGDVEDKHSNNKVAIIGGVVGGVLALLALGLLFLFHRRRSRQRTGASGFKHRPTFPTAWFSPLSSHRRLGSDITAVDHYSRSFQGGKRRTLSGHTYANLTSGSPGPPFPVSLTRGGTIAGNGNGRPVYNTMPSMTATAEYVMNAPVHVSGNSNNHRYSSGPGGGILNHSNSIHTMNRSVSTAHATISRSTTTSMGGGGSYAHHGYAGGGLKDEPVEMEVEMEMSGIEGMIVPYVLPPALPEGNGIGNGRGSGSGKSAAGHRGRGSRDSIRSVHTNVSFASPLAPNLPINNNNNNNGNANELHSTGITTTGSRRVAPERRNPPAYTATPTPMSPTLFHLRPPPTQGIVPSPSNTPHVPIATPASASLHLVGDPDEDADSDIEGEGEGEGPFGDGNHDRDGDARSSEAHRARSGTDLSGTTLAGGPGQGQGQAQGQGGGRERRKR